MKAACFNDVTEDIGATNLIKFVKWTFFNGNPKNDATDGVIEIEN